MSYRRNFVKSLQIHKSVRYFAGGLVLSMPYTPLSPSLSGLQPEKQKETPPEKLQCFQVACYYSQVLKVYVQGDIENRAGKIVFLTVHDVGTNHHSLTPFVNNPYMKEVRRKSIWLHVCVPGQDDDDDVLPDAETYEFPTLDGLAHDLCYVMDAFNLRTVIGFGEGAGANILCRFGLYYPNRVLGLMLIDCTSSTAGVDEYIKYTVFNWKEGSTKLADKIIKYLTYHKTGLGSHENWKERINSMNLCKYLEVYLKRTDISKLLATSLKVESLLINGQRAPNVGSTYAMNRLNSSCTTVVIVDGVGNVIIQAPMNLARALILFCKGCGVLLGVPMIGLEKEYQKVHKKKLPSSVTEQSIARAVLENERKQDRMLDGETRQ